MCHKLVVWVGQSTAISKSPESLVRRWTRDSGCPGQFPVYLLQVVARDASVHMCSVSPVRPAVDELGEWDQGQYLSELLCLVGQR